MARFFVTGSNIRGGIAYLAGEDAEHIKVLRLRVGDCITVCDSEGTDYRCKLLHMTKDSAEALVEGNSPSRGEPTVDYTVLAAFCKGDRADTIVQKCTECGAKRIRFFKSSRCVSVPDERSLPGKLRRWQKIAEEAAKQSGRGLVPEVGFAGNLGDAFNEAKQSELALMMYETGERVTLRDAVRGAGEFRSAAVITGPEGGFEAYEAELALTAGIANVSMGPRILRCETAPVAALTAIMYESGNMD